MKRICWSFAAMTMLLLMVATGAYAVLPTPAFSVSALTDTSGNNITWTLTNLTDDQSGFRLVRFDWLYPGYPVTNVTPTSPWTFFQNQGVTDDINGTFVVDAVSWITTIPDGLANNQTEVFKVQYTPGSDPAQAFPLRLEWQRLTANTPAGEPSSMDVGAVPEPSGMLALVGGLVSLGAFIYRRRF